MGGTMTGFFKRMSECNSGSALGFTALAMPVLVGGAGLAVDVSQWYTWKRELQFAVDQAAIAGAFARSETQTQADYATRASQEFTANVAVTSGYNQSPTVSLIDWDGGTENAVQVVGTTSRELPFTGILMSGAVQVSASAVAIWDGGTSNVTYNTCMLALNETANQAVWFHGNPTIDAACGLGSLSNASDAIRIDGAPGDYNMGDVVSAGGIFDKHDGFSASANVLTNQTGLEDPYAGLNPPENPTPQALSCGGSLSYTADETLRTDVVYEYFRGSNANNWSAVTYSGAQSNQTGTPVTNTGQSFSYQPVDTYVDGNTTTTQLSGRGRNRIWEVRSERTYKTYSNVVDNSGGGAMQPGTYTDMDFSCDTVFAPGIYVLDGGQFKLESTHSVSGTGVMFVLKNGASIRIAGNSSLNLTGITETQLIAEGVSAADAARMDGMVFFEDAETASSDVSHNWRGTSDSYVSGIMYFPVSTFSMLGTSQGQSRCMSVAANKLEIGGTADLSNLCPANTSSDIEVSVSGGAGAAIRLVQ